MMVAFEDETGMKMSFDDLTGAFTGVHEDVPPMQLDWDHQTHACSFCLFAKRNADSHMDCVRNKLAANRLVLHRRVGLAGHCHLGLYDMAEPLIFQGHVVGVFYYGSVMVEGREELARERIQRYCSLRNLDVKPYFKALEKVPVISADSIPRHRETLRTVVRLAHYFCEASGVRPELYRSRELKFPYEDPESPPYVVKQTMHYVGTHLDKAFIVKDLAAHLRCHPDFLSRRFKQHTGMDLSDYLRQSRIEHAKRLLLNPKIDIGDAAEQSGFSDRVHFSKVFRRVTGLTPGQFQRENTLVKEA
jgi:AraC-like DNA-binding protein/ligand-binding sensor protein